LLIGQNYLGVFENWSDLICAAHLEDDGPQIVNIDEKIMGAETNIFAPPTHNRVRMHEPNQNSCTRCKPGRTWFAGQIQFKSIFTGKMKASKGAPIKSETLAQCDWSGIQEKRH
jgi:hypothetical protein